MSEKTLTIGIATINRAKYLKQTINNIYKNRISNLKQIIIVDQTKESENDIDLKLYFESIEFDILYLIQETPSVCLARNTIINNVKTDIVLFFDDDILINSQTLISHLNLYDFENVKSSIGNIYNRRNEFDINELDVSKPEIGTFNPFSYLKKIETNFMLDSISCNQGFDLKSIKSIGGFDENFKGGYYEDSDLGIRFRNKGYKIGFDPLAMVLHLKAPMGGLRFDNIQSNKESEKLLSYVLYFVRYFNGIKKWQMLKIILRAGPFRKKNVINPILHIKSWFQLFYCFFKAHKIKNTVKSSVLIN